MAKLILQDEVNCKFEDLEPAIRQRLVKAVSYVLPHAKFTPMGRLGRWDGKVNFMSVGGKTYFHMLETLLPILESCHVDLEVIDERIPYNFEFDKVDKDFFSDVKFKAGHHMEGKSIVLHDHQVEAVNACLENRHGLLLASTSSGKTIITAALSKKVEKYGRSIVIVPNTDLVQQTYNDYEMLGLDAGVFYGGKKEFGHQHTITTWQSLNSLWKKTKKDEVPMDQQDVHDFIDGAVCVIVDECLDGDTLIETPNGKVKIKDMKPGDSIYSYDEQKKEFIEDVVVKLHTNLVKSNSARMLEIEMEDGSILKITDNHKVLTKRGWIEAGNLTIDDDIISWK